MEIRAVLKALETWAPAAYQEAYDNTGLICGDASAECKGVLCSLDATEAVIEEAILRGCNLVVAHHPILFGSLKRISGSSYVERAIIRAIKSDICLYAIHTNLDNMAHGVSGKMAEKIGLRPETCQVLQPKKGLLSKLYTYVPPEHIAVVENALYQAGAGNIGKYAECSFTVRGTGAFRPLAGTHPFIGQADGMRETVEELKLEVIFPNYLQSAIVNALQKAHPYETVAYEIIRLENEFQDVGAGIIGQLPGAINEKAFLELIQEVFDLQLVRHTRWLYRPVRTVALCGGAGSFLTGPAIAAGADAYITADIKYHEFFDADGKILLADIGHYESEQYTVELLAKFLHDKFPTFAVLKTGVNTNPVHYHLSKNL